MIKTIQISFLISQIGLIYAESESSVTELMVNFSLVLKTDELLKMEKQLKIFYMFIKYTSTLMIFALPSGHFDL